MHKSHTPRTLTHGNHDEWKRLLLGLQANPALFGLMLGGARKLGHREGAGLGGWVWESALAVVL